MNVKNLVLGIGIFVVYLLVLNYGIQAFYPQPQYDDFCGGKFPYYDGMYYEPNSNVTCTRTPTPQEQNACIEQEGMLVPDSFDSNGCTLTFKCDLCNVEYNDASKDYSQRVFIISIIFGILTLLVGYAILTIEPVGSALMASGVGALVYGSMNNWQNLSTIWRFLLLLAALILLVWIAIRLNTPSKNKGFFGKLGLKK